MDSAKNAAGWLRKLINDISGNETQESPEARDLTKETGGGRVVRNPLLPGGEEYIYDPTAAFTQADEQNSITY